MCDPGPLQREPWPLPLVSEVQGDGSDFFSELCADDHVPYLCALGADQGGVCTCAPRVSTHTGVSLQSGRSLFASEILAQLSLSAPAASFKDLADRH